MIGVSRGALLSKKRYAEHLQSEETRCSAVKDFLATLRPGLDVSIQLIGDAYGPSVTDSRLTAIVVSEETLAGGKAVNEERARRGMPPLDLHVVACAGRDAGPSAGSGEISSTSIRRWIAERGGISKTA